MKAVELFVDLFKAILWPVLILFMFLTLRAPIEESLPRLMGKTSKIEVAGVTIELRGALGGEPSNALKKALGGLPEPALRLLIKMRDYGHAANSDDQQYKRITHLLERLEQRQLVIVDRDYSDERGNDVYYRATELGAEAFRLSENIIISLLAEWTKQVTEGED